MSLQRHLPEASDAAMAAGGEGFAPVGRLTLQEQVYRALRDRLAAGLVTPGQGLVVRELAEQMGTSPMPVREAMRRLIAERCLELLSNGTVRVRLMSETQRADLREIRALLEGMAVARAAERISPAEIAEARAANDAMQTAIAEQRVEDYIRQNRLFHFACYRAARSDMLFEIIEGLWVQSGPFLRLYVLDSLARRADRLAELSQHHEEILEALRLGAPEAAATALRRDLGLTSVTRETEEPDYMRVAFGVLRDMSAGELPHPAPGGIGRRRPATGAVPDRETLQEKVYRQLRRTLMAGDVVPGQVVTVRAFAERFGTSPMPVREALRRLVAEGAFEPLPNGSLRVRLMSETQRQHAREIRALLEGVAVARAAHRISAEELEQARRHNEAMQQAQRSGDLKGAMLANQAFHFQLYRAARSEVLSEIIERLWVQNGPFVMLHLLDLAGRARNGGRLQLTDHHDLILDALAAQDAPAATAALVADLMQTASTRESESGHLLSPVPLPPGLA